MASIAVIILIFNEQIHIARAIDCIRPFASEIIVVDSGSTDHTVAIAKDLGARVLHNAFLNQAQQFQWALDNASISSDWVMRLDADEEIAPDLASTLSARLDALPSHVAGVNLKRKHIFLGRFIRYGGRYPLVLLRLWRRGQGRIEQRWMDEHMIVWGGSTVTFDGGFSDHNLNDLTFFTDKHNRYATREAIEVLNRKYQLFATDEALSAKASSWQAAFRRTVKEAVYNRLPFWLGPLGYFLYRYTIQLGFLDGREGLIYHGLQGFWYRFLVGAKVVELERAIAPYKGDKAGMLAELKRCTGLKLDSA